MNRVYVLGGMRTPIVVKNNRFRQVKAEELGAAVVRALLAKYPIENDIAGVISGNAVGTGGNITRLMTLLAGLSQAVPAYTVDMQCASGAVAIANGYNFLALGQGRYISAVVWKAPPCSLCGYMTRRMTVMAK